LQKTTKGQWWCRYYTTRFLYIIDNKTLSKYLESKRRQQSLAIAEVIEQIPSYFCLLTHTCLPHIHTHIHTLGWQNTNYFPRLLLLPRSVKIYNTTTTTTTTTSLIHHDTFIVNSFNNLASYGRKQMTWCPRLDITLPKYELIS